MLCFLYGTLFSLVGGRIFRLFIILITVLGVHHDVVGSRDLRLMQQAQERGIVQPDQVRVPENFLFNFDLGI